MCEGGMSGPQFMWQAKMSFFHGRFNFLTPKQDSVRLKIGVCVRVVDVMGEEIELLW